MRRDHVPAPCDHAAARWTAAAFIGVVALSSPSAAWSQSPESAPVDPPAIEIPSVQDSFAPVAGGITASSAAARAVTVAPTIERAHAQTVQATVAVERVRVAFAPRLDVSARYTRLSEVDLPPFEFAGMAISNPFPQILNNYAMELTATLPVSDLFLTILPSYRGAQAFAEAARYQEEVEREATALRAREAFYHHMQARANRQIARDAVRLLETYVVDLRSLVDAGVASRPDLADATAQLAQARVGLARARAAVDVTGVALRRLLGLPRGSELTLGEGLADGDAQPTPSLDDLIAQATARRPEIKALEALMQAHERSVSARRASRLPRLLVQGNVAYANPNQRIIPQTDEFRATWDVSVVLRWSPNDAWAGGHEVSEAEQEVARTRADLRALEDGLVVAASSAFSDHATARQSIDAATRGLEAAETGYRTRRELLAAGSATSSDVLDAETRLRRAQLELVDAHINLRVAQARIKHVIGEAAPETGPSAAGERHR